MAKYKHIEKGIRMCSNKAGDSFAVSVELESRADRAEKTYSFHIGTFKSLEKAKEAKEKAEELTRFHSGQQLIDKLSALKEQHKVNGRTCCNRKMSSKWTYCPFCGKML